MFAAAYCGGLCLALALRPSWWVLLLGVIGPAAAMVVALRRGSPAESSPAWLLAIPVCLVVDVRDGRVGRVAEYADSADAAPLLRAMSGGRP